MADRGHRYTSRADTGPVDADLPNGTQSIQRAVAVLRLLATARETGLGLTEISKYADLSHPTTHRILRVLIAEGIVEQRAGTRRYVVGEQIPLLALSRRPRDLLLDIVGPHLKAAVSEIGDTGFLTRRAGLDTVCVARQIGIYPIQVLAWDVGDRRPLGTTTAGIAILSGVRPDVVRGVIAKNQSRYSRYGVPAEIISQQVAAARARGFASRKNALTPGTSAVSVVIRSSTDASHSALTINCISRRLPPRRIDEIVGRLRTHAEAIEIELRNSPVEREARLEKARS